MHNHTQITVFGANGRVGQQVVAQLLERGVQVIAAVHGTSSLPINDNLSIVSFDIYNPASVAQALEGSTVVISTLGSWGTARKDVLTTGMSAIIPAMQARSMTRIISLTGADARVSGDKLSVIHRLMHIALLVMAPKILRDGEAHIALLQASGLDWTVVRSPIMDSSAGIGAGILAMRRPLPWQRISRQLVADRMVHLIDDVTWLKQAPYIG